MFFYNINIVKMEEILNIAFKEERYITEKTIDEYIHILCWVRNFFEMIYRTMSSMLNEGDKKFVCYSDRALIRKKNEIKIFTDFSNKLNLRSNGILNLIMRGYYEEVKVLFRTMIEDIELMMIFVRKPELIHTWWNKKENWKPREILKFLKKYYKEDEITILSSLYKKYSKKSHSTAISLKDSSKRDSKNRLYLKTLPEYISEECKDLAISLVLFQDIILKTMCTFYSNFLSDRTKNKINSFYRTFYNKSDVCKIMKKEAKEYKYSKGKK